VVIYVLDASALLRLLDGESGSDRVTEIMKAQRSGAAYAVVSAIHWGEIVGIFYKRHGLPGATQNIAALESLGLAVIPVTAERAKKSARIKAEWKIPYADAFAVELATVSPDCILVTADFDFKPAEFQISIEFLPTKQHREPSAR
jgi:predicted nucleic acid-binding protein